MAANASDGATLSTQETIDRFNAVFNEHDVDGVMNMMTEDVIFENTSPRPDGERYEGSKAVRVFWDDFFRNSPHARFDAEDIFVAGDRATVLWVYHWIDSNGTAGHVRGVDVFRVRDGKIAEKLSYVKG
ncbi:MAG: nuclear transport factor 2 family protein [Nitrolancea sp.]